MYDIFIIFIIGYILIYIKYCSKTIHKTDTNTLNDEEKKILFITNIMGYILSVLLISIETIYISPKYNNNMNVRISELIIVILLICIAYYGHIYRNHENDSLCKLASGLWPLIGSFSIIGILCLNTIYLHYNNLSSDTYNIHNLIKPYGTVKY